MPKITKKAAIDTEISSISAETWRLLADRGVEREDLDSFKSVRAGLANLKLFIEFVTDEDLFNQLRVLGICIEKVFTVRMNLAVLKDYVIGEDGVSEKLKDHFDSQKVANEYILHILMRDDYAKQKYRKLKIYLNEIAKQFDSKKAYVKQRCNIMVSVQRRLNEPVERKARIEEQVSEIIEAARQDKHIKGTSFIWCNLAILEDNQPKTRDLSRRCAAASSAAQVGGAEKPLEIHVPGLYRWWEDKEWQDGMSRPGFESDDDLDGAAQGGGNQAEGHAAAQEDDDSASSAVWSRQYRRKPIDTTDPAVLGDCDSDGFTRRSFLFFGTPISGDSVRSGILAVSPIRSARDSALEDDDNHTVFSGMSV